MQGRGCLARLFIVFTAPDGAPAAGGLGAGGRFGFSGLGLYHLAAGGRLVHVDPGGVSAGQGADAEQPKYTKPAQHAEPEAGLA